MPLTPILIISLVSGYIFIINFPSISYKIHRVNNLTQYLLIAFYSIILFIISVVIYIIADYFKLTSILNDCFPFISNSIINIFSDSQFENHIDILYILCINFGIALAVFILNRFSKIFKKTNKLKLLKTLAEVSPFEAVILDSIIRALPVSLTMSNGKVYIGFINESYDVSLDRKEIKLIPLISGYRKEATKEVVFTTYYFDVYEKIENLKEDIDLEIFYIILPYNDVKSANLFDFEVYSGVFNKK
jgi:hypothetical protein